MPDFCPECANMMRLKSVEGKPYMVCNCGYKAPIDPNMFSNIKEKEKIKLKNQDSSVLIVKEEDKINVNDTTSKQCPKCNYTEAETWAVQTRGADEPATIYFRCMKCKHTWREG